jgi:hypothetical protein
MVTNEHIGLLTVISLTQEQLEEIGSDKLPSFPWDPGVCFVSRMFMLTQVALESHTTHLGLVWSGPASTCPMGRDLFFRLIIMMGHGDVWTGTSSTEVSSLIQFLDNRPMVIGISARGPRRGGFRMYAGGKQSWSE